jgi:hypothetical protein
MADTLVELIEQAPWREAVTYRDSWPHGMGKSELTVTAHAEVRLRVFHSTSHPVKIYAWTAIFVAASGSSNCRKLISTWTWRNNSSAGKYDLARSCHAGIE